MPQDIDRSISRISLFGFVFVIAVIFGASLWSAITPLAGAVVAPGVFTVAGNVKTLQHPYGGVVSQILVREGYAVEAGQVILILDDTQARAALGVVRAELDSLIVRRARLVAERDGASNIDLGLLRPADATFTVDVQQMITSELRVFSSRRSSINGQKNQLHERIVQLREEISAYRAQNGANVDQLRVAGLEMADVQQLMTQGLIQRTRVTQLEREIIRVRGSIAELDARIAQTEGRIREIEVQLLQLDREFEAEVARDLRETEGRILALEERRIAAEDVLARVEMRAPVAGYVHQLQMHTVGGVIMPQTSIMQIVPRSDDLLLEVRVSPLDIERIVVGQVTRVRLTAFNPRTTPEVVGEVVRIGADLSRDAASNQAFYTVAIRIRQAEIERLQPLRIVPGMPGESLILTGERTFFEYMSQPLVDQFRRAFRER